MSTKTQTQDFKSPSREITSRNFSMEPDKAPEMRLYSRYEHGNLPVKVFRGPEGQTLYEVGYPNEMAVWGAKSVIYTSAKQMISAFYGHEVHMPFDRYFRIGRYRQAGRASGQADLLTLLDARQGESRKTPIIVHGKEFETTFRTQISVDPSGGGVFNSFGASKLEFSGVMGVKNSVMGLKTEFSGADGVKTLGRGLKTEFSGAVRVKNSVDPAIAEFLTAMEGDLSLFEGSIEPTEEMKAAFEMSFALELDRVEGLVGMDLGARSGRAGSFFKADEVRKLLWRGFAGKMLSQGYDPEDVAQEVYRGLLVRNNGKCPWDARKSTFGHYIHMCIDSILTNYHRKQSRRIDKDAIPLTLSRDGEEMEADIGQFGSCKIWDGSELGEMLALGELAKYLEMLPDETPEAELGKEILPLVASGHQRSEIVQETGRKPSLVSRALAWLRRQTALWATESGLGRNVPTKYLVPVM